MQKRSFITIIGLMLVATVFTGCKSRNPWSIFGSNPTGVRGSGAYDLSSEWDGNIAMGGRDSVFFQGAEHRGELQTVYFDYDSNRINDSERAKVEAVAAALNAKPKAGVVVEGHCDERGSREYNLALGERRSQAVREYLVGLGIAPERIQTRSFGEEMPAVQGNDESAWRKNRRAEFVLYY